MIFAARKSGFASVAKALLSARADANVTCQAYVHFREQDKEHTEANLDPSSHGNLYFAPY